MWLLQNKSGLYLMRLSSKVRDDYGFTLSERSAMQFNTEEEANYWKNKLSRFNVDVVKI